MHWCTLIPIKGVSQERGDVMNGLANLQVNGLLLQQGLPKQRKSYNYLQTLKVDHRERDQDKKA
jgi:hypothetical protein